MIFDVTFPCGDIVSTDIVKCTKDEICVKMEYGPIWVSGDRVVLILKHELPR